MSHDPLSKRRHLRVPVRVPIRVSTIDSETDAHSGRTFFRASREWCANLSRGGVYVRTAEPLTPGRRVLLELQLPDGTPVEATGRVAWSRRVLDAHGGTNDAGVGIEFLGGAQRTFDVLESFLRREAGRGGGTQSDEPTA
jgi:uncharacterized protein (TIGR02266 family)